MRLRRFTEHTAPLTAVKALPWWHKALQRGESMYQKRVTAVSDTDRVFIDAVNNRKIGAVVQKGRLQGFHVYTLTLQERKTCPASCKLWSCCYGNNMNWPKRIQHGPDLEKRIPRELKQLQQKHPQGYLVRLHVLGDFYSVRYVELWEKWLKRFPALHVYGYTQWGPRTEIGAAVSRLRREQWERFSVRTSNAGLKRYGSDTIMSQPSGPTVGDSIVCPVETNKSDSCAECGLCWNTKRSIVFVLH